MTLTKDAKWGWEITSWPDKPASPAKVLCNDMPGDFPWAAYRTDSENPRLIQFREDGTCEHSYHVTLRDAPCPKASGTVFLSVFRGKKDGDTLIYVVRPDRDAAELAADHYDDYERLAVIEVPWTEGNGIEQKAREVANAIEVKV